MSPICSGPGPACLGLRNSHRESSANTVAMGRRLYTPRSFQHPCQSASHSHPLSNSVILTYSSLPHSFVFSQFSHSFHHSPTHSPLPDSLPLTAQKGMGRGYDSRKLGCPLLGEQCLEVGSGSHHRTQQVRYEAGAHCMHHPGVIPCHPGGSRGCTGVCGNQTQPHSCVSCPQGSS